MDLCTGGGCSSYGFELVLVFKMHYIPKTIILISLISHNISIILTLTRIVALYQPVATAPPTKKIKVNNAGEAQSVYYCHLCGFEYIVKFNLQKHLERQHKEEERNEVPE
jgi:hypothetical protein